MKRTMVLSVVLAVYVCALGMQARGEDDGGGITLAKGVSAHVLLEAEASYESQGDDSASDIVSATFEFGIDAKISENVSASVLLLWEEDDTEPVDLDEAVIKLGGSDDMPVYLEVGKLYVPFGAFNTHVVSDPMVLELAETRETALLVGYGDDLVQVKLGAFNGELDENEDDQVDDGVVASVVVTPADGVECGVYWISDIGESGGLQDLVAEVAAGVAEGEEPASYNEVGGAGGYVSVCLGALTLECEYITALDDFKAGLLGEQAFQPMAWNVEVAFAATETIEVAVKVEGSDEFPGFPETQYGVGGSIGLSDHVGLAFEYLRGEFDGEDGRNLVTVQVGVAF